MKSTHLRLKLAPKLDILKNFSLLTLMVLALFAYSCSDDDDDDDEDPGDKELVLEEIAMGARLHGTNGINFGPDGDLYIASFIGQEVVSMNKQTGEIINTYGVDKNVLGPDDLIFHPDGESFYYTDIVTGFVGRMTPDGTLLGYQEVAPGVNPITFSDDGRLFVGLDFEGDGLYELDPNLVEPPRAIVPYVPDTFPLGFLNAFDFGPDGRLYGPSFLFGLVISVDVGEPGDPPTSDPYGDGTAQVVADGFTYPVAAKFGPDGLLYLLDQTGEVFKIDVESGETTLFTTLQPGLDNLAFDADGNLYVSNADFGWIVELLPSGDARTVRDGGIISPQGIAVLEESNRDAVYVADVFRMQKFNGSNGENETNYKGYLVPQPEKLTMPFSVQADGENLVVSSWLSTLVQVWNPSTDQALEEYAMVVPIDALSVNNEIVVSDLGLGGVVKASDQSQIAPLVVASGLATDGETLWAADWATGQVWQIDFEGGNAQAPVEVATGLLNPEGLAFEKEGYLVVIEAGATRLSRIELATGEVTILFENLELGRPALEGFPPTSWFDGVAVGPSGDIYASGWLANVLYRVSEK
jgi:sugar lactone lactonase YvrE